ncbi:hypothetical protein J437_LFUL012204 [Ladona fulva]|uniref:Protein msta n=1 Tax=Ladona fulva TaxID=123851 RepID=A0A8K0KN09_LADFU|nr:hypothetical protein J437_LFUL012204 [Ladona fulva]
MSTLLSHDFYTWTYSIVFQRLQVIVMSARFEEEGVQRAVKGYEVESSESVGRRLVAAKDTVAGEVVLKVLPLATGPMQGEQAPCLVCYRPLQERVHCCPDCGWPLCSQGCSNHARHAPECLATAATGVKISFEDPTQWDSLYDCVFLLRCLSLRISSPSSWNQIQLMETHDNIKRPSNHRRRSEALAALFTARFGNAYGAKTRDILHIIATLEINAMEVTSEGRSLQALYPEAFYTEHSCVPTSFRVFGSLEEGFPLVVHAAVNISKGSPISLTYTDSLWGTLERRTHLYYSKFFLCNCERCSDREELGACLTGLKCDKCGDCVLPVDPLSKGWLKGGKAESLENWSCKGCKERVTGKMARKIVWDASEAIKELENDEDVDIDRYEMVLEMLQKRLHSQHSLVVDLKHSIIHILNPPESISDDQLIWKEKLARDVIQVANILFPGISLLKGACLYELASTLLEKTRRDQHGIACQLDIRKEAEKYLEESIYHLHYQPKCQPEYLLLIEAREKLKRISTVKNG